jgi:hypothetical protein
VNNSMHQLAAILLLSALALTPNLYAGDNRPDFLSKVQLHNLDGFEPSPDGKGVSVYRLPAEVREHLSEAGARIMVFSQSGEIRFVLKEGARLEDVTIRLKSNRNTSIMFYRGDELCGNTTLIAKKGVEPYIPPSLVGKTSTPQYPDKACEIDLKPAQLKLPAKAAEGMEGPKPAKRFPEQLCRVVLNGGVITLTGIEGDIRPPKPEELPPVLVSYGTSISMGAAASKPELSFTALTAAALGYSLRNLGCSGSAFCEPEMADYLAKQPGDLPDRRRRQGPSQGAGGLHQHLDVWRRPGREKRHPPPGVPQSLGRDLPGDAAQERPLRRRHATPQLRRPGQRQYPSDGCGPCRDRHQAGATDPGNS